MYSLTVPGSLLSRAVLMGAYMNLFNIVDVWIISPDLMVILRLNKPIKTMPLTLGGCFDDTASSAALSSPEAAKHN